MSMAGVEWLVDEMDAGDADQEQFMELHAHELRNAWAGLLSTREGRFIAWSILDHCHVYASSYTGNAASNFLEGERSVGLKILREHILPHGPQTLADMMIEAQDRFDHFMAVVDGNHTSRGDTNG